ncbi:redoxin domain-containing protein [Rhodohalobacter sulfatireducens]|uniref:Redoxin domain-containing protein n=1 Tax=Rhodohalobacter sulfatireducens TaxID=2911366 RepID=A0ABS9KG14_9BACT|nr:redoxin domain-containing protein [Rhodohalobacter sulfatireducens]MCG2589795.1 redoxin domain-containing protein [Rhodohalobacter sulfatireducens]MDR9364196.1 redoxin domain-containing protein [Balneolaceae bacterium]MDR9410040.1 redoxin domain-containing protein [Balneolaceae bacterium]
MKVGDTVKDFALHDTQGQSLSLSELLENGKALILFFPLAFSSVCTDEMCHFRDNKKLYNSMNANILGISVDSFFTLREFKRANNFPFPFVSDFNKEVSRQFGVLYEDYYGMKGVAKRSAFVINKDNVVEYAEVLEDSGSLPDFKAIQKVLEK